MRNFVVAAIVFFAISSFVFSGESVFGLSNGMTLTQVKTVLKDVREVNVIHGGKQYTAHLIKEHPDVDFVILLICDKDGLATVSVSTKNNTGNIISAIQYFNKYLVDILVPKYGKADSIDKINSSMSLQSTRNGTHKLKAVWNTQMPEGIIYISQELKVLANMEYYLTLEYRFPAHTDYIRRAAIHRSLSNNRNNQRF